MHVLAQAYPLFIGEGAQVGESLDEYGPLAVKLFEQMATVAEGAAGDCKKAATDLQALLGKNGSLLATIKKAEKANPASKKEFDKKFGKETKTSMEKLVKALDKCQGDKDVAKVFEAFE